MSTELAIVIVSSIFSAVVAVAGIVAGVVNSKRADQRAEKQAVADLDKLKAEQAQAQLMLQLEAKRARRQEVREHLRKDATEYIALLAEIHDITTEMRTFHLFPTLKREWESVKPSDRWDAEIRGRVGALSAALTLYGGRIEETAIVARNRSMSLATRLKGAIEHDGLALEVLNVWLLAEDFAEAVRERLKELDEGVQSELATTDEHRSRSRLSDVRTRFIPDSNT